MYNPTRLEWHLGDEVDRETLQIPVRSCQTTNELLIYLNRLLLLLPRAKTAETFVGFFAFGRPNAERRWLGMRYPVTRANQSRESGLRIELGGSGKSLALCASKPFKSVQCDVMTRLRKATSKAKANPHFDAVRLCFVPTLTKRLHRGY